VLLLFLVLSCAQRAGPVPDSAALAGQPFPTRMATLQAAHDAALVPSERAGLLLLIADAYRSEDMLAEAERAYRRLLRDTPQHPDADRALAGLALTLEGLGRADEAAAVWRSLLEQHPDSPLRDSAAAALRGAG